jgi:hypothetical protein
MRLGVLGFLAATMGGLMVSTATAEPLAREDVPEPLAPWVGWVLRGHEDQACPFLQGEGTRACVWPGRLELELDARGGRFRQSVFVARASEVALPGGGGPVWPEDVRVDGVRAPVGEGEGGPRVHLAPGAHEIEGRFVWSPMPPGLRIPNETGLVELVLDGERVARPRRDAEGALWLREASAEGPATPVENRVDIEVARRFQDAVPPRLQTLVTLRASGETREEVLGLALPAGWLATAIGSPLPARLDPDGRLRVQLRPGDWTIVVDARMAEATTRLAPPKQPEGARWDESEVWSIALAPELRLVELAGAPSIDPTQAEIPGDWHALPTYRLEAGSALALEEKRRGSEGSPGDQLMLQRTWYLDFDGGGATVLDQLQGTLRRSLRLEMGPGTELGRIAIDGVDQPITRRGDGDRSGIETALGRIALDADSRIPANPRRLSAVGWDHDVDQLSGTLWLPPGYRLLHASGVDSASETWVSRWNLLSVFFVLLMAVVSVRLFGKLGAAWAFATLVLVWNEPGAPARIWLVLAVFEALRRAVARGRFARAVQVAQGLVAVVLVAIAVPFAIAELRGGLFPALGHPGGGGSLGFWARGSGGTVATEELAVESAMEADQAMPMAVPSAPGAEFEDGEAPRVRMGKVALDSLSDAYSSAAGGGSSPSRRAALEADPSAIVPTGPGRPDWAWEAVALQWSGPVTRDHALGLWLLPPWANGGLAIARVVLVVGLAGLFVRGWRRQLVAGAGLGPLGLGLGGVAARGLMLGAGLAVALGAVALEAPLARAEMPTPELLDELRNRLLENPECTPNCAVISRLELEVGPERLRLSAVVEARAETGVPLPGGGLGETSWQPASVQLDGRPAEAIRRDASGVVWLRVARGTHEIVLEGPMPPSETVALPLPLAPRRTALVGSPRGWSVAGIGPDGVAVGALQLVRDATRVAVEAVAATNEETLAPSVIQPFAELTRRFELGLRWRTSTRVQRIAPAEGPIVLEIPLVKGEAVTTPGIVVEAGRAKLTLAAGVAFASYESTLEIAPAIELAAPADRPWSEVWQLSAAPVWHVETEGLAPVDRVHEGARTREWRPWPGEKLRLAIERPAGLEAATRTIDRAALSLSPGARATDATLALSMRSSQGGQHVVTLPEAAALTSISIDGQPQPLRQEGREVSLALAPGSRTIVLAWREARGIRALLRGSEVGLGADAVNATVEIAVPENRWVLFTGGPRLGPTVLFWPTLLVVAGLAFLIARTGATPLATHHWLLLGLGLTQASIVSGAIVVAWFLGLALRGRFADRVAGLPRIAFRAVQIALGLLTVAAAAALIHAIGNGLLGTPSMRIAGNGSSSGLLRWYVDRSAAGLPMPWMLSLSIWWYRAAMLAWSMWLALALVEWSRWGFARWSEGGLFSPDSRAGGGASAASSSGVA